MSPQQINITAQNDIIEIVELYPYLGHATKKLGRLNQDVEIKRRAQLTTSAFSKLAKFLKNSYVSIYIKNKVYKT